MTAILFVAIVIVVIVLFVLNDKINKLQWENSQLKRQVDQLWGWIRQHNANHAASYEVPPVQPQVQAPPPPYFPPVYSPPPAYTPPAPYVQPSPVNTAPAVPPQPAAYANPAPIPQQRVNVPPQPVSVPVSAASGAAGSPGRMENWFGRNVLGVAASILFFVGLIVFAAWIYNDIPEAVKIFLMYGISGAVAAAGIALTIRRRNNFTLILTGCGCGLLFISILLTYVYFGRLNDIATFSLLLVWLAAALVLARQLQSTLISLVAHVGMGVSLCFAYAAGLQDDKLVMLFIYQAASIALIVVGNILCCRKTYRFGLFLSVVVTLTASAFMFVRFIGPSPLSAGAFPLSGLPDGGVAISFFAQFLCVSILSYLLAVSTTRLGNTAARLGIHLANKALWIVALCMNVLAVVVRLTYTHAGDASFPLVMAVGFMAATGIVLLLVHALLSIFMSARLGFDGRLETISVLLAGGLSAVLLFILWITGLQVDTPAPHLPLLLLPAGLLLLAGLLGRNTAYRLAANILLGTEWGLMALFGFHELTQFGTVALSLLYMTLYAGAVWLQWLCVPLDRRRALSAQLCLFTYFYLQVTSLIILAGSGYRYWHVSLLMALIVFNLVLGIFRADRRGGHAMRSSMRAVEGVLLAVSAAMLAFMPRSSGMETALYAVLAVVAVFYAFFHMPSVLGWGRHNHAEPGHSQSREVYLGVKFSLLALAIMQGFTTWFAHGYVLTVAALATLLACLAVGYACKAYGLVRYALIAALPCMMKLLCFDVPFHGRLSLLIGLLAGCFLLFLMHLLYDRFDTKASASLTVMLAVVQHIMLAACALAIAFSSHAGAAETTLIILLTVLTFIWAFLWVPRTLGRSSREGAVLEGVKLTVLVLATVHGYTDWFANAYALSLVCMLTSLVCVIAGFVRRAGSLRLYGLVLTMVCVLKLVTWDVAGLETLLRILSLIGGGVICFVISAIYSYSVKHLSASDQQSDGQKQTDATSGNDTDILQ